MVKAWGSVGNWPWGSGGTFVEIGAEDRALIFRGGPEVGVAESQGGRRKGKDAVGADGNVGCRGDGQAAVRVAVADEIHPRD